MAGVKGRLIWIRKVRMSGIRESVYLLWYTKRRWMLCNKGMRNWLLVLNLVLCQLRLRQGLYVTRIEQRGIEDGGSMR